MPNRKLNVFLCHAKEDKPTVRELYRKLVAEGWMEVWLDEENLFPGQEWDMEIEKAVEQADVVVVSLFVNPLLMKCQYEILHWCLAATKVELLTRSE